MSTHDLVIRGGRIYDGTGSDAYSADIAVNGGIITEIGDVSGKGRREMDADGLVVTPGFVDIHTHYDGQATWDSHLSPTSDHGVTTAVMGNCGVGFAPCRPQDRDRLIRLMEGVEDIPNPVLTEGLAWNWESFDDYLDALSARPHDIDFATQIPHGPLRVFVMGERGAAREPAADEDIAEMARLAEAAIRAGALGFSTSRTLNHRTSDGDPTPSYMAARRELVGIANALGNAGAGILQIVSDFTDAVEELSILDEMMRSSGRPMMFTLAQAKQAPDNWKMLLNWVDQENAAGLDLHAMVCGRPVGILLGWNATMNPFSLNPAYAELANLPIKERLTKLRQPETKAAILNAEAGKPDNAFNSVIANFDAMFVLGETPDYEQPREASLSAKAARLGKTGAELAYDAMMEQNGEGLLYTPFLNYADFNLDPSYHMMRHPNAVLGLGDGGAHVGMICDGSFPTSMITHWTRDRTRGEKLPLEWVIKAQCRTTAETYGFFDRGLLRPGYKADINLINYDKLRLHAPHIVNDLPAGGKRLMQKADGYVATLVSGTPIRENGEATGELPGQLVRGKQFDPVPLAAE